MHAPRPRPDRGDADAQALYVEGERVARRELPTFDTGAWSLYSRGSSEHESDLSYHQLLRSFLRSMCDRTDDPVYCDTELRFAKAWLRGQLSPGN